MMLPRDVARPRWIDATAGAALAGLIETPGLSDEEGAEGFGGWLTFHGNSWHFGGCLRVASTSREGRRRELCRRVEVG
jgi:hypothetical protein